MNFSKFEIADILHFRGNATDEAVNMADESTLLKYAKVNYESGPAYTGTDGDKVICAAGIQLRRGNVGRLWSVWSKDIPNKFDAFRCTKTMLDIVVKEFGFKRVITESRIGFEQSQRLLEHLGFNKQRKTIFNHNYLFYRKVV